MREFEQAWTVLKQESFQDILNQMMAEDPHHYDDITSYLNDFRPSDMRQSLVDHLTQATSLEDYKNRLREMDNFMDDEIAMQRDVQGEPFLAQFQQLNRGEPMRPFEQAWAVLKADPRMQAYEIGTTSGEPLQHPDYESMELRHYPDPRNRGTIDPNVMMYRPDVSTQVLTGDSRYTNYHSPYVRGGDNSGFESVDPHGISRASRPQASPLSPRQGSPQHVIDSFMADGSPLTPEDEAELARRLRMVQQ